MIDREQPYRVLGVDPGLENSGACLLLRTPDGQHAPEAWGQSTSHDKAKGSRVFGWGPEEAKWERERSEWPLARDHRWRWHVEMILRLVAGRPVDLLCFEVPTHDAPVERRGGMLKLLVASIHILPDLLGALGCPVQKVPPRHDWSRRAARDKTSKRLAVENANQELHRAGWDLARVSGEWKGRHALRLAQHHAADAAWLAEKGIGMAQMEDLAALDEILIAEQ